MARVSAVTPDITPASAARVIERKFTGGTDDEGEYRAAQGRDPPEVRYATDGTVPVRRVDPRRHAAMIRNRRGRHAETLARVEPGIRGCKSHKPFCGGAPKRSVIHQRMSPFVRHVGTP